MRSLLFHVVETFEISGRGLVVAGNRNCRECGSLLTIGDPVEICSPKGTVKSFVAGVEFADPFSPTRPFAFLLPQPITKDDVPVGAAVWYGVEENSR